MIFLLKLKSLTRTVVWAEPWQNQNHSQEIRSLVCVLTCFSRVRLFVTPWTIACQAPLSRDSPGKNTGVGCHALLQGIFLTKGLNPRLLCFLHQQTDSLPTVPPGTHGTNAHNTWQCLIKRSYYYHCRWHWYH